MIRQTIFSCEIRMCLQNSITIHTFIHRIIETGKNMKLLNLPPNLITVFITSHCIYEKKGGNVSIYN